MFLLELSVFVLVVLFHLCSFLLESSSSRQDRVDDAVHFINGKHSSFPCNDSSPVGLVPQSQLHSLVYILTVQCIAQSKVESYSGLFIDWLDNIKQSDSILWHMIWPVHIPFELGNFL